MTSLIAYVLHGHDNNSYMLQDVNLARCPSCGGVLDRPDFVPSFAMRKKLDVSATYDGYTIASQRFVDEWEGSGATGLNFASLPLVPDYFAVTADRIVEFDSERRKTRFEKFCSSCDRFEAIAGATPAFLKRGPEVLSETEAVRTDILFGSGDQRHPLIIIPLGIGMALKKAKLSGMALAEVWA